MDDETRARLATLQAIVTAVIRVSGLPIGRLEMETIAAVEAQRAAGLDKRLAVDALQLAAVILRQCRDGRGLDA